MEKLLKKVKQAKGNILSIGFSFSGDVVKTLQKNKKVKDVHILSNKGEKPNKKKLFSFDKKVRIKKIKKYYKDIDYIFIEFSQIEHMLDHIVKNTIDMAGREIYLYFDKKIDYTDEVLYRFKRYGCTLKEEGNLITIYTYNIKCKFLDNIKFSVRDTFYKISEYIAIALIGS